MVFAGALPWPMGLSHLMWLPQQQPTAQPASQLHLSSTSNDQVGMMEGAGNAALRRPAAAAATHMYVRLLRALQDAGSVPPSAFL